MKFLTLILIGVVSGGTNRFWKIHAKEYIKKLLSPYETEKEQQVHPDILLL